MAFTLSCRGAYKTVYTQEQVDALLATGWTLASGGSAGDTTLLNEFPSYLEDYSKPGNPTQRGIGMNGDSQASLGYLSKQKSVGLSKADYDLIREAFMGQEHKTASVYTDIVIVDELPDEQDENTIYLLKEDDGEVTAGLYTSNAGHWVAYTPGDVYDANHGADVEMAKLAAFVSSVAFTALPIGTANTKSAIETILLAELQALVAEDYTVSFVTSAYNDETGVWTGKFKVAHDETATNTVTDAAARTLRFGAFINMKLVLDAAIKDLPYGTENTKAGVEAGMLSFANALVGTGYAVTVVTGSTYNDGTKAWAGKLKVTETANAATNNFTDASNRAITVVIAAKASDTELAKVTDLSITTLPQGTENTKAGVEAAILAIANGLVAEGFTVTIASGSTYEGGDWTGKLTATMDANPADTTTDAENRVITISITAE